MSWPALLIGLLLASFPFAVFVGRFIAAGQGPETLATCAVCAARLTMGDPDTTCHACEERG